MGARCRARCRSRSSPSTSTCTRSTPAGSPATSASPAGRTSSCRPASSRSPDVLPREQAIDRIKRAIEKTYGRRGAEVVERNQAAVDRALDGLHRVEVPERVTASRGLPPVVPAHAPEFVRTVTAEMLAGRGDELPVSALPVDGTYPSGTAAYEKRSISEVVAVWDSDLCIQCGNCSFVCPHSVIRSRYYDQAPPRGRAGGVPIGAARRRRAARHPLHAAGLRRGLHRLRAVRRGVPGRRAGRCRRQGDQPRGTRAAGRRRAGEHRVLRARCPPATARGSTSATVRGTQFLEPLFEFSGACAGCGETPYLKLLSQLFGDRLMVANATGCSSIYGGNLPTTPWTTDADGRGPAWSNSLFEDNAEFGLGFRLAADRHTELARRRLAELRDAGRRGAGGRDPGGAAAAGVGAESAARAGRRAEAAARRAGRPRSRRPAAASSITWSGAASGLSAATAGPTTSAPAGSTTSWPAGATSTCSCSTPRSTPTPAARCRRPRRSARSRSSPPPARPCPRRTSHCRRSPTATSTSPGSRWAPIRSRR